MIPSPEIREVSVMDYFRMVWKRVWIVIILVAAVAAFLVIHKLFFPKTYVAKATILIKENPLKLLDPQMDPLAQEGGRSASDIRTQLNLLESLFIAQRVAQKLNLNISLDKLRSMMDFELLFDTNMVVVSATGPEPVLITDIANTWIREFIYQDMERRMSVAQYGVGRLEGQLIETLERVQVSEKELNQYLKEHGDLADREQRVERLKNQKYRLEEEIVANSSRFKEKHQKMVSLRQQLKKVDADLRSEMDELVQAQSRMGEYNVLKKKAEVTRAIYEELIQRAKFLDTSRGLAVSDIRIIDVAQVPTMPMQIPSKIVMAMFAGGLIGGIFICLLLEYFDRSLKNPQEVEGYIKLRCLGHVSSAAKEFPRESAGNIYTITHRKPYSRITEDFIVFNVSVRFSYTGKNALRTILVTSVRPREGKTFITAGLGISFAQEKESTLLVDTDNVGADLSGVFGATKERGWSTLVKGECTLDEAVVPTGIPNLSLLPAGPFIVDIAGMLVPEKLDVIFEEMAAKYKRIIVDVPALSVGHESFVLGGKCDGTLIVIRQGVTSLDDVNLSKTRLLGRKVNILGAVLNDMGNG